MSVHRIASPEATRTPPQLNPLIAVSHRDELVAIGPVLPEDIGPIFIWLNDAESAKTDKPFVPIDGAAFKIWMDNCGEGKPNCLFSIRKVALAPVIGFAVLKNIHPIHRSAEFGIRIGREEERGKSYGTRAATLTTEYAFRTLNLHRVSLTTLATNARAIASYRRAGFREEGILRQANYIDGQWHDVVTMARLRSD